MGRLPTTECTYLPTYLCRSSFVSARVIDKGKELAVSDVSEINFLPFSVGGNNRKHAEVQKPDDCSRAT